jgi:1-acyl-sn-glycerol-3-phosphate acyltransferase
LFYLAGDM